MSDSSGQQGSRSDKDEAKRRRKTAVPGPKSSSILDSLPVAVVAFDADLKVVAANRQVRQLIRLGDYIDESLASGTDQKIWLGWTEQIKTALSTGEACTFDNVDYRLNAKTRQLQITCTPLPSDKTRDISGGTMVIEDVTQRLNLQKQLADAERFAALGQLASKVAHELNNPIDGILRYVNLAVRIAEQEKSEKIKEYLTPCREGLIRMVQIISDLLEFSRSSRVSVEYVRIEQIIDDAVRSMESAAEALNIQVVRDYSSQLPKVCSGNLFQVFCNLIKNALDAMPDGGQLYISTRSQDRDTIEVEFRDTGTGFPPEDAEMLFEPFFTTKGRHRGTGLGLAICRDILASRHDRITARNAPQGGSIFRISLRATERSGQNS
ncbi:MAG: PAS domain-containing protein [Sedimentisphaerales bacterium]|nr:PAS domain-containing protein [Sedimentisphaerales bacterium]